MLSWVLSIVFLSSILQVEGLKKRAASLNGCVNVEGYAKDLCPLHHQQTLVCSLLMMQSTRAHKTCKND